MLVRVPFTKHLKVQTTFLEDFVALRIGEEEVLKGVPACKLEASECYWELVDNGQCLLLHLQQKGSAKWPQRLLKGEGSEKRASKGVGIYQTWRVYYIYIIETIVWYIKNIHIVEYDECIVTVIRGGFKESCVPCHGRPAGPEAHSGEARGVRSDRHRTMAGHPSSIAFKKSS